MDTLSAALGKLTETSNTLQAAISQVDALIKAAEDLQTRVQSDDSNIIESTAQTRKALTDGLESLYTNVPKKNHSLKGMYGALNNYDKALKTVFKETENLPEIHSSLEQNPHLVDRSLALHFSRENEDDLLKQFSQESDRPAVYRVQNPLPYLTGEDTSSPAHVDRDRIKALRASTSRWWDSPDDANLRDAFSTLNKILESVRRDQDLRPAIEWAQLRRTEPDISPSKIEFELCMLQYITILRQGGPDAIQRAWEFAATTLSQPHLWRQDSKLIQQLVCALAFPENLALSPYNRIFDLSDAWEKIVALISREFCIHMNIPSRSPLHTVVNAGVAGIPALMKFRQVMKSRKAEWSTSKELPVEVPLPPAYIFHPIFVCPVSKEQATASNPPMMLPCGHVISATSVDNLIHMNSNFKCPYCPRITDHSSVKPVYLR